MPSQKTKNMKMKCPGGLQPDSASQSYGALHLAVPYNSTKAAINLLTMNLADKPARTRSG